MQLQRASHCFIMQAYDANTAGGLPLICAEILDSERKIYRLRLITVVSADQTRQVLKVLL